MYFSVRSGEMEPDFRFEADTCDIFKKSPDPIVDMNTELVYSQTTARGVLDDVENEVREEDQSMVLWTTALFDFYSWSMPFRDYKKIHGQRNGLVTYTGSTSRALWTFRGSKSTAYRWNSTREIEPFYQAA